MVAIHNAQKLKLARLSAKASRTRFERETIYATGFPRDVTAVGVPKHRNGGHVDDPTKPPGIALYSCANAFLCLGEKHAH